MNLVSALRLISPVALICIVAPRRSSPVALADRLAKACVVPKLPAIARLPSEAMRSPKPPLISLATLASVEVEVSLAGNMETVPLLTIDPVLAAVDATNSIALSATRVTGFVKDTAPLLTNRSMPPAIVMLPLPNWASDPICSTPASMRVTPLYVLVPLSISVPLPNLVRFPAPDMIPA